MSSTELRVKQDSFSLEPPPCHSVPSGQLQTSRSEDILLHEIQLELKVSLHHLDLASSFVRNGGDSLSALRIASSCRLKGLTVTVAMIMRNDSIIGLMHELHHNCRDGNLSSGLADIPADIEVPSLTISKPRAVPQHPQATRMQLSLIHGSKSMSGCNVIRYYETYAPENIARVKSAWQTIVSKEPIFRTRFQVVNNQYHLFEEDEATFTWEESTTNNRATYLSIQQNYNVGTGFMGSIFRVVHLNCLEGPQESTVIWNIHHALIDGYSATLILNKHRMLLAGHDIKAGPSFAKFIERILTQENLPGLAGRDFWSTQEDKLQSARSELNLPHLIAPYNPIYSRRNVHLKVNPNHLHQYSKTRGVTTATLFYAAWALTLSKYVNSNDICFGVVLSGRSVPVAGIEAVIGPLINTVPFLVSLDPKQKVSDFLMSVFKHAIALDSNQWSMAQDGNVKSFPAILNVHFVEPPLDNNPLGLLQDPKSLLISSVPLSVEIYLGGEIHILFHEHVFRASDIERLASVFADAINALVDPDRTVGDCGDYLLNGEIKQIWENSNCSLASTTTKSWSETLVDLVDQTSREVPSLIAIEKGSESVTYSQLHVKTDAIGHFLRQHIQPGEIVCVHADRSINWVLAAYGILKAGGVYCPLDAALPSNIRNQNFSQSGSSIFLVNSDADKAYQPPTCQLCFSVGGVLKKEFQNLPTFKLEMEFESTCAILRPDANAYLCYTSGSTGKPKGVLCTHRSLVAFQKNFDVRLRSRPGWRIAQVMSPAFDGSIHEIFSALSYGSTLVLQSSLDPFEHLSRVDATVITPSIADILNPDDLPSIRALYLVGEAVSPSICDKWASRVPTFNMYGPTEGTCGATIKELKYRQDVTLGKPVASSRLYVLDDQLKFTPIGVVGEIYLAGVQVSNGYINQPEESARKFLADCILPELGERMYRTGDRGYWDEQGELRFCGRNDRQIKLRGFRIDLDDIEVRIRSALPDCTNVAVTYYDGELIAQIKNPDLEIPQVRERLSEVLPAYAIPRRIAVVSEFPHTNAGKVDYKAIKASTAANSLFSASGYDAGLMDKISTAWKEVLQRDDITLTAESNFIELGGYSLLQLQMANRLSALLGYSVPLRHIIQSPTLGDLVQTLSKTAPLETIHLNPGSQVSPVSPTEESWWRRYRFNGGSSSFNVALCFELGPDVEVNRLAAAWNQVLDRHMSLRCRFLTTTEGLVQKEFFENPTRVKLAQSVDVRMETNQPFNLEHDYLIRVTLTPDMLVLVASHIICDYTALNTILNEAGCAYKGVKMSEPTQINGWTMQQPNSSDTEFWKTHFRHLPSPSYSLGELSKRRKSYSGSSHLCRIEKTTFLKLNQFLSSRRITAHQVSLAAVALALQHHCETIDVVLGAPYLGRSGSDAYGAVGLFLEPLPVRVNYLLEKNQALPASKFLSAVRESSQSALSHAMPWHEILGALNMTEDLPENPLFDVMVSYHENFGKVGIPDVDAKLLYTWTEGAKFKLMVEFVAANDTCLFTRLEYSDECFKEVEIALLGQLITHAFEMLVDDAPLFRIKETLARLQVLDVNTFYGVKLGDL